MGGSRIRVERKSNRGGQQPRRMQSHLALNQSSPARAMGSSGSENVKPAPATPLRSATASGMVAAPSMFPAPPAVGVPSGPPGTTNAYYGGDPGIGMHNTPGNTPGYAPPYGNFPATPQGTPGVDPYNPAYGGGGSAMGYPANPYYWAAPYLTDPNVASMAYYHNYYSPVPPSAPRDTMQARTPTKSAGHEDTSESGGIDEGSKSA